ncbi:hypothetical protein RDWZM_006528 [Blomia tropicalis]|uniref:DFP2 n=1 Tax=Blomia tropicalis TaxID=40697 RepID=A0A9Q0RNH3_BLOTA|nr:hypothetical protein RDWZM_006528 [Blomia tropicalis]
MLKFSVAVLCFVGFAAAQSNPLAGSIKGYGLLSPTAARRQNEAALASPVRAAQQHQQPAPSPAYAVAGPSYGPVSTKGSKSFVLPNYRPRIGPKIGPVSAAVITSRSQEVIQVPVSEDIITPQVVIIEPNLTPVTIEFRSRSSPVNIQQVHIPGTRGQTKTTRSEEEPDRVIHEVLKPVIQEVREIIQPFRKITQQILPVQEEVLSVVSKGERKQTIEAVEVPKVEIPVEPTGPEVQQEEQHVAESVPSTAYIGSGTIVQAGLIGGARIMPAEDSAALLGSVNNRPNGLKVA